MLKMICILILRLVLPWSARVSLVGTVRYLLMHFLVAHPGGLERFDAGQVGFSFALRSRQCLFWNLITLHHGHYCLASPGEQRPNRTVQIGQFADRRGV
jgi:hypothetical protein